MMKGVSESLAGRVAVIHLLGLSRRELAGQGRDSHPFLPTPGEIETRIGTGGKLTLKELHRLIWRGAFPAIALNDQVDRNLFYSSYVQAYLQRDVRDLARVGDEMAFLRFLRASAARTGQMLNIAELARDTDVAFNTARNRLSILQASGIVYLLEPYHNNVTNRLVKTPRLYFLESSILWSSRKPHLPARMTSGTSMCWEN
ncbi:MAG: hypothetical protein V1736_07340 [Pseudomonadota bacterium]